MSKRPLNDELLLALGYFGGGASGGGGGAGTTDYTALSNKPKINGLTITGPKTLEEYEQVAKATVSVSDWSAGTVTIAGASYYTNEIVFTDLFAEHPSIFIAPITGTLPTPQQREAFGIVQQNGYMVADVTNKKITVYSTEKPLSSFAIYVKGAKL